MSDFVKILITFVVVIVGISIMIRQKGVDGSGLWKGIWGVGKGILTPAYNALLRLLTWIFLIYAILYVLPIVGGQGIADAFIDQIKSMVRDPIIEIGYFFGQTIGDMIYRLVRGW